MRYRNQEVCTWTQGEPGDLFTDSKQVVFKHYVGAQSAKIYVQNDGYKIVKLVNLHHNAQVMA